MRKVYVDTETCGFHSQAVLIQYAFDDGRVELHDIWLRPAGETVALIESFLPCCVVGFNLVFDWFHLCKIYTQFRLLDPSKVPTIADVVAVEKIARDGPCIKPASALDLMLHSRKGRYQSLMGRKDTRIRRVPTALAQPLADELTRRIEFDGILFAGFKDKSAPRWRVYDRKDRDDCICPHFKDVVLKFNPAGGLKFLAEWALGVSDTDHLGELELPAHPSEHGWAPFAEAVTDGKAWPERIADHIAYWRDNERARSYAINDVLYTRELEAHFGNPEPGDDDSVLACMVGAVRWHGYAVDCDRLARIANECRQKIDSCPINTNKPSDVRAYLFEVMDETERLACPDLEETTKKGVLMAIRNGVEWQGTEAAKRAAYVLDVKTAHKVVDACEKIIKAGRFHAAFDVIGAKSNRMSGRGSGGLNPQGMKSTDDFRSAFLIAWPGMVLCGGDFSSFELTIMDAVYNDETLREVLQGPKKLHALFAQQLRPDMSYEEIKATEHTPEDWYTKGKQGLYGRGYGSEAPGMAKTLGVTLEQAERAIAWFNGFKGVAENFEKIDRMFGCLVQPGGRGSKVIWRNPESKCTSFLGFSRDFSLEIKIARALFELAADLPAHWRDLPIKVARSRDRMQTAAGAVSSALYGAAFGVAGSMKRAAANHEIQSPGGQITKHVQRAVWDIQPAGVHEWRVAPMNVHDELLVATHPDETTRVKDTVDEIVTHYQPRVPLIGMEWATQAENWADVKGHPEYVVKIPANETKKSEETLPVSFALSA